MAIIEPNFPKSPFVPVEEPMEQLELLQEAAKTATPVVLWTKRREFHFDDLKIISFNPSVGLELEAKITPDLARLLDTLKRTEEACYFTFGLWRCGAFFTASLEKEMFGTQKALLRFKTPKNFFKVQRRNTFRLPIKPPYLLLAEIKMPGVLGIVQRKISDISLGGLAILTSPADADDFQKGRIIGEMRLTIRNRQIVSSMEVRHSRLVNKETFPQLLVGLRFLNANKKDLQLLDRFITEETKTLYLGMIKR